MMVLKEKSAVGVIFWGPWLSEENVMAIHPVDFEIFWDINTNLMLVEEANKNQNGSSSGDHKCLKKISWQSNDRWGF